MDDERSAGEIEVLKKMRDDAVRNGEYETAAELDDVLKRAEVSS